MSKILVVNGFSYANAIKGLGEIEFNGIDFIRHVEEYSLVMFTGGEDISPELYGDKSPANLCMSNPERDEKEAMVYNLALDYEIPMTGICRGAQLLNVLNGGKMMHHLDGHSVSVHGMRCLHTDDIIKVNSLHHQMIIPGEDGIVVGWADKNLSRDYYGNNDMVVDWNKPETEVIYYPNTRCFGVQYHPEIMSENSAGYRYYYEAVRDLINMDIDDFTKKYAPNKRLHIQSRKNEV